MKKKKKKEETRQGNANYIYMQNNIYKRNFKNIEKDKLLCDFTNVNWDQTLKLDEKNSNISFNIFFETINTIVNKHAPLKKISNKKVSQGHVFKPNCKPANLKVQ